MTGSMAASAPMFARAPQGFGAPPHGRRRRLALATSFGLHALVVGGLLVLGGRELERAELPVVRLVFDEPAPPPLLGPGGPATGAPGGRVGGVDPASARAPSPSSNPDPATDVASVAGQPAEPAAAPAVAPGSVPARVPAAVRAPTPPSPPRTKTAAKSRPAAPVAEPATAPAKSPEQAGEPAAPTDTAAGAPPAAGSGADSGPGGDPTGSEAGSATGRVGGTVGGLGTEPVPAGSAAVPPAIVSRVMPEYPEVARMRGQEGQVMLEAVIGTDGRVEPGVKVIRSIPDLDRAAVEAFRRWRFQPARDAAGRPIRVILQAPVRFVLR